MSVEPSLLAVGAAAGAALAIAAALLQWRMPMVGLAILLAAGVLAPLEYARGQTVFNVCIPIAGLVCGTFFLRLFASERRVALDGSRAVLAALAFMAIAVVAFAVGQYPWFPTAHAPMSAQLGGLGLFLLSGGVFLAVGHQVRTARQLEWLTWAFLAFGAMAVVTSLVSVFDVSLGPIAISNASSIGSLFWTWIVAIGLSQALFNRDLSVPGRLAAGGIAVAALARGVFAAFSWASGWLPALAAAAIVLFLRLPRATIASGLLFLTPVLLFGAPALGAWMAGEDYSSTTRMQALEVMWDLAQRNPWLGFGPANYYQYTVLFPIAGWWVRFNSHNNYVDLVGQVGLVGLTAFVWFALEQLRLAVRLRPRVAPGFPRAYLVGAIAGLAGSLVSGLLADWIVPFVYNVGLRGFRSSVLFWFFLGGVVALRRMSVAGLEGTR